MYMYYNTSAGEQSQQLERVDNHSCPISNNDKEKQKLKTKQNSSHILIEWDFVAIFSISGDFNLTKKQFFT